MMLQATGVVLAGGKSTRMGIDKALLLLESQTMLERSVKKLQEIFAEVIIVGNSDKQYLVSNVKTIPDILQECGPLGGIYTALRGAAHDRVLITACDMPFWGHALVNLLLQSSRDYDGAVPMVNSFYEPLLAVYAKSCLPAIADCLEKNRFKVTGFYDQVRINAIGRELLDTVCNVDVEFSNINTREDLRKWYH